MKVGELFFLLGFKVNDNGLRNFDNGLKQLTTNFDLAKIGAIAAIYAMERFIDSSITGAIALYNFTQQTGNSAQALQQWQAAAHAANPALGIDQISQSIQTLENNLVEIRRFGAGNASPFAWLKVDIGHGQNAIEVLEQLRERVSTLDRATAVNLIQKMGLNPGFINILTRSREEFDKFIKDATRSDPAILALEKLGEKIALFKLRLTVFKDNVVASFAPGIMKMLDTVELFARGIGEVFDMIKEFAQQMPDLFKGMLPAIALLTAALFPLTSALTALLLLLNDFAVYRKGGKSVIGEVLGFVKGEGSESIPNGNSLFGDTNEHGKMYQFFHELGQSMYKITTGELKKNYRSIIPLSEAAREATGGAGTTVNRNVTINNDISINSKDGESIAEKIVRENQKVVDQVDLNWSYTDQSYKGAGY